MVQNKDSASVTQALLLSSSVMVGPAFLLHSKIFVESKTNLKTKESSIDPMEKAVSFTLFPPSLDFFFSQQSILQGECSDVY